MAASQAGRNWAGLAAALAAVTAWILTAQVAAGRLDRIDESLRAAVAVLRTPAGLRVMLLISHLSSEYGAPVTIAVLGYLIYRRNPRFAVHFTMVAVSSTVWLIVLKGLVGRPRPWPALVPYWQGMGYPSGHTLGAVCLSLLLLLYVNHLAATRAWPRLLLYAGRGFLVTWPVLVGLSRVYIDAHWTVDVIGGLALGLVHFMTWYYLIGWRVLTSEVPAS